MKESHAAKGKLAKTQACEQDCCTHCGCLFRDLTGVVLPPVLVYFAVRPDRGILERSASQTLCCASLQTRVIPGWHLLHVCANCFLARFCAGISGCGTSDSVRSALHISSLIKLLALT
ncbi:TPA: hypothetical protein ACH3X2_005803 [Trebouxia sp. C0005]